jgi:hypothetical protein
MLMILGDQMGLEILSDKYFLKKSPARLFGKTMVTASDSS